MGHQKPTRLEDMTLRGCRFEYTVTDNKYLAPGWYGKHDEYTNGCFDCWIASGGSDD